MVIGKCLGCGHDMESRPDNAGPANVCSNCGHREGTSGTATPPPVPTRAEIAPDALPSTWHGVVAYSICYWFGLLLILGSLYVFFSGMHVSMIGEKVLLLVFVVGLAMFLSSLTIALVKLHRAWNVIQPLRLSDRTELGMPSPGIAVGLLFVPILGAYWLFPAQAGLAIRMNKFIRARSFGVQPLSVPLAIALSCSQLLIPAAVLFAFFLMGTETFALSDVRLLTLVVMLPALANILLQYSFVVSINRATDDLLEALSARAA